MTKTNDEWLVPKIIKLAADVHDTLRTFTESVGELDEGYEVFTDSPEHREYESYIQSVWALHEYLYSEV